MKKSYSDRFLYDSALPEWEVQRWKRILHALDEWNRRFWKEVRDNEVTGFDMDTFGATKNK